MATITHKTPGFTGSTVVYGRELDFADGVAEADLNPAEVAAVHAHGHLVTEAKVTVRKSPKRSETEQKPAEIGSDVPVTESADDFPTIG